MPESTASRCESHGDQTGTSTANRWQPHPRAGHTPIYHIAARILRVFLRLYGRWTIDGAENVPRSGPVLLACNHVSYLDPVMVLAALYPYRFTHAVAKYELWRFKVLAWFLDQVGASPVKRHSGDFVAIRRVLAWLEDGESVLMFPEGGRSPDGTLKVPEQGVGFIALKSNAPIVPVAVFGSWQMLPAHRNSLRRSRLRVVFGQPQQLPAGTSRAEAAKIVMDWIRDIQIREERGVPPKQVESCR